MAEALFTSLKQVYLDIGTARVPMIGVVLTLSEAAEATNKSYTMPGVSHRAILDMIANSSYITMAQGIGTRGGSSSDPYIDFSLIYDNLPANNTVMTIYDKSFKFFKQRAGSYPLWTCGLITNESSSNVYLSINPTADRASSGNSYDYTAGFLFIDGSTGHILGSNWAASNCGYTCKFSQSSIHTLVNGIYPVLSFSGGSVPFYGYSSDISITLRDLEISPYIPPTDPYAEIPESGPGGGDADFDFTNTDDIDFPSLPSLSAVSTGFISLWAPDEDQMLDLSSFMWNADVLTINFWKKLVTDPMDLIYGLNIIPLELTTSGTAVVTVGLFSTGIEMNILGSQWVELDCGYIDIDETWGAYLDYDPFTKLEIYLPYCGTHPLKVDDFMPGRISLKYHIDVLSGSCVAMVRSTKSDKHNDVVDSVMYQFMGNCATQIPVTASQYADAVRSAISLASSIGSLMAGPGAGAAMTTVTSTYGRGSSGRMRLESKTVKETTSTPRDDGSSVGASTIDAVMGMKPSIERSGAIGASGGMLSVQTPYLILTRPRQARPVDQNKYTGYPSFITETLSELEGLTIVKAIHMNNMSCTTEELNEIETLLRGGVIF